MNGYIIAVALILLAFATAFGYKKGSTHAAAQAEIRMAKHIAFDREAELLRKDEIIATERALAVALDAASKAYEGGKKNAENLAASTITGLRNGTISMQRRWQGCEAERLSEATAGAGQLDAAARDREESASRIIRAAAECDSQVHGLQSVLELERAD